MRGTDLRRRTARAGCAAMLTAALLALGPPVVAQSADDLKSLKNDIETLKEGQAAIQKELQEIKSLLRATRSAAAPSPDVLIAAGDGPARGSKDARLTLVEFTDYQ
jgi:hypothetical protein